MYNKIEREFKNKSAKHAGIILMFFCLIVTIIVIAISASNFTLCLILASLFVIAWVIVYLFIFMKNRKNNNYKSIFYFFWITRNIEDFGNWLCEKDKGRLQKILRKYRIDSKDTLQESLRHFRTRIPTKPSIGGFLVPLISIAISIAPYFFDDSKVVSYNHLEAMSLVLGVIIIIAFLVSMCIWFIATMVYFVQYSYYSSIENIVSTLYFECTQRKEKKAIKKKPNNTPKTNAAETLNYGLEKVVPE